MLYLGIDVGKRSSSYFVMDRSGERVCKGSIDSTAMAVRNLVDSLRVEDGLTVALESGNVTFTLARELRKLGAAVWVIHPRDNAIIALSRKKTDGIDAKTLADQVRRDLLPPRSVYIPDEALEDLRHLVACREANVTKRTRVVNQAKHMLARYGRYPRRGPLISDSGWVALREECSELRDADQELLTAFADQAAVINYSIRMLEKSIRKRIAASFVDEAQLLDSVPGLGPVTISSLIAWAHPISRFPSARHLMSYAGLVPSVRQSGARTVHGGTARSGNPHLGRNLVQAAHAFVHNADEGHELHRWYGKLQKKRGWRKARVGLGRKLAAIAYGVLRHQRPYDPQYVARTFGSGDVK